MNPQHKLNKLANRARRLARRTYHKDLNDKGPKLPEGNLLLVATISHDSDNVTRALRSIAETTLAVAQAS